MDLEKILPVINEHLSRYEKCEIEAVQHKKAAPIPETTIKYEISDTEEEHGKARVIYGYVYADFSNKELHLVASVLSDILCGSNASPLKRALLDSGLAKDAAMYSMRSREHTLVLEIRDADETKLDEIDALVKKTISDFVNNGIDKDKLHATLNSIEFRTRERDFGTLPSGIAFAMSMFGAWMYGAAPERALRTDELSAVRKMVDDGEFEELLTAITIDNHRKTRLIMLPDKTLSEKRAAEEREELDKILKSMSDEELKEIIEKQKALTLWQQSEDDEEAINSLPTLAISDIPANVNRPGVKESTINKAKILRCPTKTNDIVYLSLHFDASDLSGKELIRLTTLSSMLINSPTKSRDALSLQNDIKANLGVFSPSFALGDRDGVVKPYFNISVSALCSKTDDILRLVREVLLTSKVDDETEIFNILSQMKSQMEEAIISSGEALALSRVQASVCEIGAISEYLSGYEAYQTIKEILSDKEKLSELAKSIADLLKKLTKRERLRVFITGDVSDEFVERLVGIFDEGEEVVSKTTLPCAEKNEFTLVPSKVAYAVLGGRNKKVGENVGLMRVARSMLCYEYLWQMIRVKNGAYGTGFIPRRDGTLSFYSYRDPNPAKSVEYYRESSAYLRALADTDIDITKFIIGAIGEYDFIITPKTAHAVACRDYLSGYSEADEIKIRGEMLSMTAKDLYTVADIIDEVLAEASLAVVGGEEHLCGFEEKPKKIIKI